MTNIIGAAVVQGIGRASIMISRVVAFQIIKKSKYQEIVVADLEDFGRSLILDGYIQSAELDEYIYHESLVHPAMVLHPNPRRVLIIGGGEGATLREVLKHRTVERVVMVDIDEDVVNIAKQYLKQMHRNSFDDPRAQIVIADGKEYIERCAEQYDVIILDLTDPYSAEISKELYTEEFYRKVYERLTDDGIAVTQAGNSFFFEDVYDFVLNNIRRVFPLVFEYNVWIPSFGYACNFILGSKKYDPYALSAHEIDRRLTERGVETKFFCGATYLSMRYTPIYRRSQAVKRSL